MHVAHVLGAAPRVLRRQYPLECLAKFRIENGVDDRIERRVRVAEPAQDFERLAGDARLAERRHNVDAEERHPADQEHAHYHANRDGRLVIGHMVRRRVVQVAHFELLLWLAPDASVSVLLLFRCLLVADAWPRDGSYRFHVLLCIAV